MSATQHQAVGLAALRAKHAPLLAVVGAKGGVGKTTLAVNLALLFARMHRRVLLADLDPGCGNVAVHLRLAGTQHLDDVLTGTCTIEQIVQPGPHGIGVVSMRSGTTTFTHRETALAALAALEPLRAQYDLVVADTGAGLGHATLATLAGADAALAVTTPDLASVTDAYALFKVLSQHHLRLPSLVINRVRGKDQAMRTATRLRQVSERFLRCSSDLAGWVSEDPEMEQSLALQQPLATRSEGQGTSDLRALAAAALALLPRRELPAQHRSLAPQLRGKALNPSEA